MTENRMKPYLLCLLVVCSCGLSVAGPAGNPTQEYFILFDTSKSMGPTLFSRRPSRMQCLKEAFISNFLPHLETGSILHLYAFDKGIHTKRTFELKEESDTQEIAAHVNSLDARGASTYAWRFL